ncbi:MAG TPA: ubiquitin-like protein Pup, partial [Nitrospira sp.]|nr:ubiquitin-like protein Pup [Nitrospira sp.]
MDKLVDEIDDVLEKNAEEFVKNYVQKTKNAEEPTAEDLYQYGTIARIIKMLVLPDGNTTIIIQGKNRFSVKQFLNEDPYLTARVELLSDAKPEKKGHELKALVQSLQDAASKILKLNPEIPQEAQVALDN